MIITTTTLATGEVITIIVSIMNLCCSIIKDGSPTFTTMKRWCPNTTKVTDSMIPGVTNIEVMVATGIMATMTIITITSLSTGTGIITFPKTITITVVVHHMTAVMLVITRILVTVIWRVSGLRGAHHLTVIILGVILGMIIGRGKVTAAEKRRRCRECGSTSMTAANTNQQTWRKIILKNIFQKRKSGESDPGRP